LVIANRADSVAYRASSIEWSLDGHSQSQALSIAIAPKSQALVRLPVTGIVPCQQYAAGSR